MKTLKEYVEEDYQQHGTYKSIRPLTLLIKENLKPGITVAEVGVFDGATTMANLPIIKEAQGTYYAIDWFNGTDESAWGVNHADLEAMKHIRHYYREGYDQYIYPKFLQNIESTGCADVCKVLKGKSLDMCEFVPDDSLDICLIDADHSYVAVMADIKAYLPKVKKGGIICGHDYDASHVELMKAVNESFSSIEVMVDGHDAVWVRRL